MITVRLATSDDIPSLAILAREQAEYQAQLDSGIQVEPHADWIAYISARLRRSNAAIFVGERDGVVVGYTDIRIAQQGVPTNRSHLRAFVRRLINSVRKVQPSVLGYRRYGLFEDIYVSPTSRLTGAGLGIRLINASIEWFQQQQIHEVECVIDVSNEAVQTIALKYGFKPVKTWMRLYQ